MTDIQMRVERDLSKIAYHIDKEFPARTPFVLLSAMQVAGVGTNTLAILLADNGGNMSDTSQPAKEARRCALKLGYRFDWFSNGDFAFAVSGSARRLSQHERLEAIALFASG